jgi:hypothetical protein
MLLCQFVPSHPSVPFFLKDSSIEEREENFLQVGGASVFDLVNHVVDQIHDFHALLHQSTRSKLAFRHIFRQSQALIIGVSFVIVISISFVSSEAWEVSIRAPLPGVRVSDLLTCLLASLAEAETMVTGFVVCCCALGSGVFFTCFSFGCAIV